MKTSVQVTGEMNFNLERAKGNKIRNNKVLIQESKPNTQPCRNN